MRFLRSVGIVLSVGVLVGIAAAPAQATPRITEYPVPTVASMPQGITSGPDGNLWFTELAANKIGRITTGGVITSGPDGNLWFTEFVANKIGRITTGGTITEYPVPTSGGHPDEITSGSDTRVWFTEFVADKIGALSPSAALPG